MDERLWNLSILELVTGKLADNRPFYALLSIPFDKHDEFQSNFHQSGLNLTHYGEVLESGLGYPTKAHLSRFKEEYGFEDAFIEKMAATVTSVDKLGANVTHAE